MKHLAELLLAVVKVNLILFLIFFHKNGLADPQQDSQRLLLKDSV